MWFSVRCTVDVCNSLCRYNVSLNQLPYTIDDGASVTAPLESDAWQYYKVPLGNFDILDLAPIEHVRA